MPAVDGLGKPDVLTALVAEGVLRMADAGEVEGLAVGGDDRGNFVVFGIDGLTQVFGLGGLGTRGVAQEGYTNDGKKKSPRQKFIIHNS